MIQYYDIIGDVHGYADKLHELLEKMGYSQVKGVFQHPTRKAIFVGDWIDRGPQIRETLALVRAMIDNGQALAVLGNHEYNALTFHLKNSSGNYLRPHTAKNIHQHEQTLQQFGNYADEWTDYLTWFLSVPLFLDLPAIRVVHACWDEENIELLKKQLPAGRLTTELIYEATIKHSPLWKAVEETLKGKEAKLPYDQTFSDKDGHVRHESRIKWWVNHSPDTTYAEYFFDAPESIASLSVDYSSYPSGILNEPGRKPVFFGHYWLQGVPQLESAQAACVDFSVAKGNFLTAYRWQGETDLVTQHLVWV